MKREAAAKPGSLSKKIMETSAPSVSQLLQRRGEGDCGGLDQLMPLVYAELRRMARRHMNQQPAVHTLRTLSCFDRLHFLTSMKQQKAEWPSCKNCYCRKPRRQAILASGQNTRGVNLRMASDSRMTLFAYEWWEIEKRVAECAD
jgi:hypothetical protein